MINEEEGKNLERIKKCIKQFPKQGLVSSRYSSVAKTPVNRDVCGGDEDNTARVTLYPWNSFFCKARDN